MTFRATSRAFVAAAALLVAPYATSAAWAFTIENQGGASGGQGYLDTDKPAPDRLTPASPFNDNNGQSTVKQGNTTFQFGQQRSFDQRYNTNNIFNPYARDGR